MQMFLAEAAVGTDLSSWLTSITGALGDFSVTNLITIITAVLGLTVGLSIFWFALRFVIRKVSKAFRKGSL